MNKRSLVLLIFFWSGIACAALPQPSPSPSPRRPRIADLDRGIDRDGSTAAERHPWIGRIENLIEVCLMFVGIHRR